MKKGFEQLKVLKKVNFQTIGDLKELDLVLFQFNQIKQPIVPKKDWLQCQLALVEGFTNAVRHAHKDLPADLPIEIEITLTTGSIEIRIWDYGAAFDLEKSLNSPNSKQDTNSFGGRGIQILNKIADRLSYVRVDRQRNCLLIVKFFNSESDN